jgi:L-amino acid N-acyltransferase YncA
MVTRARSEKASYLWAWSLRGGVIGWLGLSDFYDGRLAYHATAKSGVYVAKEHRGKEIGCRLVDEVNLHAPELGLKPLMLRVPSPVTRPASRC